MRILAIVAVAAWVTLAFVLAGLMVRRGYDHTSWLIVSLLFGPLAALLVVAERAWAFPRRPRVVETGRPGRGDLDALVVADAVDLDVARAEITQLDKRIHRLVVARVLPIDGPREVERLTGEQLRADAEALGHPDAELVLLFGVPSDAVARHVAEGHFDLALAGDTTHQDS